MSLSESVSALVEMVESGQFLEALPRFYAPDVQVQENDQPPRVGLDAAVENERRVLSTFPQITSKALATFVRDDQAVIRWSFDFVTANGTTIRLDELALQTWRDGLIVAEKFYYDPAQMQVARAAADAG
jgi:ketosteroid isomerase-like protein